MQAANRTKHSRSAILTSALEKKKGPVYFLYKRRNQVPFLVMLIIPVLFYAVMQYWPMFGTAMAFQNYKAGAPFFSANTNWVGFQWFERLFNNPLFGRWVGNTLIISALSILFCFPASVALALLLNEIRVRWARKVVSNVTLLPYFISTAVIVAIMSNIFSVDGVVNAVLAKLGMEKISFMSSSEWFRPLYIGSSIWSSTGFSAVVFTAAISGIDPELYDAAALDGSTRWKNIFTITLPCIMPTVVLMLILQIGNIMTVGYEKIILMYSPGIYDVADTLTTYAYRAGILDNKLGLSTAINLFNTICNLILLVSSNWISKKVSGNGL